MSGRRRVIVLGSTGSIGTQALEVIAAHPDRFELVGLAAGSDDQMVAQQVVRFGVARVALADSGAALRLRGRLPGCQILDGPDAATELAAADADVVLNGIAGARGLAPTLAALRAGTVVALANKESLIVGGDLVVAAADAAGGREQMLVPVDSEHSAIAQCLRAGRRDEVRRLVLTASGGPFRGRPREDLARVTPEQALAHPTWDMGPVITVNSATLMNKGLELIEAHELFDVGFEALDVVIHPQSVVHSLVEFVDGSSLAQLSPPDMRLPIQLALAWPERLDHPWASCDWTIAQTLTFEPLDRGAFPAITLAEEAGQRAGSFPAVLNAANEVAVEAFLAGRLGFPAITDVVSAVLSAHAGGNPGRPRSVEDLVEVDGWARARAAEHIVATARG